MFARPGVSPAILNNSAFRHILKCSLSARLVFLVTGVAVAAAFASEPDQGNARLQSNRVFLMEATIECGWGYRYSVSSGTYSSRQVDWLRSILAYVNNGEVNRKDFAFEEYIGDGLSSAAIKKIIARRDFREWADNELIKTIESLLTRRSELLGHPPSFFSHDDMFKKPIFQAYWTSRRNALELLQRRFHILQEDNGVDCN
jgi:hypothetical protein